MGAYIIIGSSAAGLSAAQTIRRLQPDREIIVLSKDKAIYSCIKFPSRPPVRRWAIRFKINIVSSYVLFVTENSLSP